MTHDVPTYSISQSESLSVLESRWQVILHVVTSSNWSKVDLIFNNEHVRHLKENKKELKKL